MQKRALRFLGFATVVAFLTGASVWAQQPPKMSAALTNDVRDIEVQKQLIALGFSTQRRDEHPQTNLQRRLPGFARPTSRTAG